MIVRESHPPATVTELSLNLNLRLLALKIMISVELLTSYCFPFLPARRYIASADISCCRVFVCPSVCLSVCLTQIGVLVKRLNVGSREQRHTIFHAGILCSFLM